MTDSGRPLIVSQDLAVENISSRPLYSKTSRVANEWTSWWRGRSCIYYCTQRLPASSTAQKDEAAGALLILIPLEDVVSKCSITDSLVMTTFSECLQNIQGPLL